MIKVIEVTKNCNVFSHEFLAEYSDEDLLAFAKENEDTVKVHPSLEEFSEAFNTGQVSDQGYIYFVDDKTAEQ